MEYRMVAGASEGAAEARKAFADKRRPIFKER